VIKAPELIMIRRLFPSVFVPFQVGLPNAPDCGSTAAFASSNRALLGAWQSVQDLKPAFLISESLAVVTLQPRSMQILGHFPSRQHMTMRLLHFKPDITIWC